MRAVAERGFRPRRRLDAAAEIDPPHRFVAHHLFGGALGDALADIHREHAVDQRARRSSRCDRPAARRGRRRATRRSDRRRPPSPSQVRPANGSSISSTCGSRAIALAISILRRSANGSVAGRRSSTLLKPDAGGDGAGAFVGLRVGEQPRQLVGQQRELDVLQHRLPMQRARVLEHDADAQARDVVRRPAGDLGAVDASPSRRRAARSP